jgi:hypothetical protein
MSGGEEVVDDGAVVDVDLESDEEHAASVMRHAASAAVQSCDGCMVAHDEASSAARHRPDR